MPVVARSYRMIAYQPPYFKLLHIYTKRIVEYDNCDAISVQHKFVLQFSKICGKGKAKGKRE